MSDTLTVLHYDPKGACSKAECLSATFGLYSTILQQDKAIKLLRQLRRSGYIAAFDAPVKHMMYGRGVVFSHTSVRTQSKDPLFKDQWHLSMIGVEKAWDKKITGLGSYVSIVDTGVAYQPAPGSSVRCSDLDPKQLDQGWDFINDRPGADDKFGHGSHCAGTVGQWTNNGHGCAGIAYDCKILTARVLDEDGYGTTAGVAAGILWSAEKITGHGVISMSLGSPYPNDVMHQACRQATEMGILVVAAAGNSNSSSPEYPAAYPEVMSVASVGPTKSRAFYSSYGNTVDISAPGGDQRFQEEDGVLQNTVYYDKDVFAFFQGTSMACPHVSGAAALFPTLTRQEKWDLLTTCADVIPEKGMGAGLLNIERMVKS